MKAVQFNNVTFSYDKKTNILEDANFSADYGEVCLVSGHSGAGKSTILSILSGIIPNLTYGELSGEVLVDGESVKGKKMSEICHKVGVVLQNADEQIVYKKVEDEIAFACENMAFVPDRIAKQIDIVCGLLDLRKEDETRKLSGGQKQRLITACTLAMTQKIIILDEPLANLDREGGDKLMNTLRQLAGAGYCVIVIEHRLDMVLPFVDKVWHLEDGHITEIEDRESYLGDQTEIIPDTCPEFCGGEELFRLNHLAFSVKDKSILTDVDCTLPRGGRVVILGENGAGKTTLLRLIARLNKPTGGFIEQNIDKKFGNKCKKSKKWFERVGVIYQNPDYQLFMPTVTKEIEFGAKSKEYAHYIMKLFDLESLADRHPQSLSAGQKRRVSIAAVLACEPEVLLLDEPTVGQDYEGLCRLVEILNDIHKEKGNTIITITHDARCAEALCDRAYVVADGKITREGGKELVREYFGV